MASKVKFEQLTELIARVVKEESEHNLRDWDIIRVDGIIISAISDRQSVSISDLHFYEINGLKPVGFKIVGGKQVVEFNIRGALDKIMPKMYFRCSKCCNNSELTLEQAVEFGVDFEEGKLIETESCHYDTILSQDLLEIKNEVTTS